MHYYPFSEHPEKLVFTCCHFLEGEKPLTFAAHHFDDNNWQFLCSEHHADTDAVIITIGELLELDPSIEELCDLPVGYLATRKNKNAKWISSRIPNENAYSVNTNQQK